MKKHLYSNTLLIGYIFYFSKLVCRFKVKRYLTFARILRREVLVL